MKSKHLIALQTKEAERMDSLPTAYPRPTLVRDSFLSLDGLWDFSARPAGEEPSFHARIRVPFPPESALSGIGKVYPDGTVLTYRRSFSLPEGFFKGRVILHVGATDQCAEVTLNGVYLGKHEGGYLPFSFDITEALTAGENTLTVVATDHLDSHVLPYGKQRHARGGMWYTPVSGIWQTVWLESVPEIYIRSLTVRADERGAHIVADGVDEAMILVRTPEGILCEKMKNGTVDIRPEDPRLWSPEDPYLYRFELIAGEDRIHSYFACRSVTAGTVGGKPRLLLNGKPYFFHGLLDQGYFPDGIFTPAHPSLFERDIKAAKELGFNTLRKHIKIEPEIFYYDCDRLGMIVFQDMVNNGHYSFFRDTALPTVGFKRLSDKRRHRSPAARAAFLSAMEETVRACAKHPSVCYWTIFNEGWGQFCADEAYDKLKQLDSTRVIDSASGWFYAKRTDVESPHVYFKPVRLKLGQKPLILSEFGGYSHAVKGHVSNPDRIYGYRTFACRADFEKALLDLYRKEILPAVRAGLSGAIYTQLTDVEDEVNGLLTYDRKVCKVDPAAMRELAKELLDAAKE